MVPVSSSNGSYDGDAANAAKQLWSSDVSLDIEDNEIPEHSPFMFSFGGLAPAEVPCQRCPTSPTALPTRSGRPFKWAVISGIHENNG